MNREPPPQRHLLSAISVCRNGRTGINVAPRCGKGVLHEHGDGLGAYAAGDGGDVGAQGGYFVEADVATEAETAGSGSVGDAGCAYVHYYGSGTHHVGCDEAGLPDGGDEDVRTAALFGEVPGAAVAHGDGGVAVRALHHESGEGLAYDVGPPEDDDAAACGLHAVAAQEFEDALWSGGNVAGKSGKEAAGIDGMEAVHILAIVDGLNDPLLGYVAR